MRISDWSSDVCSSDLLPHLRGHFPAAFAGGGTEAADEMLARRLADWRAAPPLPSLVAGECAQLAGDWSVHDNMLGISAIRLAFDGDAMRLSLTDAEGEQDRKSTRLHSSH